MWRVHQGAGVLKLGIPANNDPTAMPSMIAVGLTDMDITVNPNIEISPIRSAQMFQPYSIVETGWAFQIGVSLDQIDPYNLALFFSFDVSDAVTSSSIVAVSGQQPSPYRAARLSIEGPGDTAASTRDDMNFDFYKTKWIGSGEITISPNTKSTLPITIHALANSTDKSGEVTTAIAITSPAYE